MTRLAASYYNMRQRVKGSGTKRPEYYTGLECEWESFAEFREWAIESGFSKETSSIDRIDPSKGYTRANCRWVSLDHNRMRALENYHNAEPEPQSYY